MNPQMAIAITGKNAAKPAFDSVVADANRAAQAIESGGARAAGALNGAGFQTSNLAAQFNDIGVMLASGQSPLLLAIQQGTQISQVLGPMKAGAALQALKGALLSIVSPLSLITIGSIAAGAALFQYLTSLNNDGRQSTEVLQAQEDLIRRVAENWGDAVPALRAYVDQLDRASETNELNQATDLMVGRAFEEAEAKINEMRAELAAARIDIEAVGGSAQEIDALQGAFVELQNKIADGTATTADLDSVLQLLAGTTGAQTVPSLMGFRGILEALIPVLAAASQQASTLRAERDALLMQGPDPKVFYDQQDFIAEQERLNSLTSEELALERELARISNEAKSSDVVLSEEQALQLANDRLAAEERRSQLRNADRSSERAVRDLDRERQAVEELIEQLEHEQSLLGLTNQEKEIQNALRQAGAAATDEERQRIEMLVRSINQQEEAAKAVQEVNDVLYQGVDRLVDAWSDGKLEMKEVLGIATDIAKQLFKPDSNGGSLISMLLGGLQLPGAAPAPLKLGYQLPGYADGTNDHPGGLARIFERGAEIVDLPKHTRVIPHELSKSIVQGGANASPVQFKNETHYHNAPPVVREETSETPGGRRTDVYFAEMVGGALSQPGSAAQRGLAGAGRITKR